MNEADRARDDRLMELTAKQMLIQQKLNTLLEVLGPVLSAQNVKIEGAETLRDLVNQTAKKSLLEMLSQAEEASPEVVTRLWAIIKDAE